MILRIALLLVSLPLLVHGGEGLYRAMYGVPVKSPPAASSSGFGRKRGMTSGGGASGRTGARVLLPECQQSMSTVSEAPGSSRSNVVRSQSSVSGSFQSRSVGQRISSRSSVVSSPFVSGTLEPWPE